jgi:hypothetical protein
LGGKQSLTLTLPFLGGKDWGVCFLLVVGCQTKIIKQKLELEIRN